MKPFNEIGTTQANLKIGESGFHGDVIVTRIQAVPDDYASWSAVSDACLAYGEATGHAHKLFGDFELRENPKTKERVFIVKDNVVYLKHQEHHPVAFAPGIYKHGIQREYDHINEAIREVAD